MVDRYKIAELLASYKDLDDAVFFNGEEYVMNSKYHPEEWSREAQELLQKARTFIDETAKQDTEFGKYVFFQNEKNVTEDAERLFEFGARTKNSNQKEGHRGIDAPVKDYFEIIRDLTRVNELVLWLKKKYGCVDLTKIDTHKRQGIFGDFKFDLAEAERPTEVKYQGKRLALQPRERQVMYKIFDKCYYQRGNDISIDDICTKFNSDEVAIRKNVSNINKEIKQKTRISQNIIRAVPTKANHYHIVF